GFHGYDIDLSLQIGERYQNQVVYDILLEHFSTGTLGRAWLESTFLVADKWRHILPRSVHRLSAAQFNRYHWQSLHVLIQHMFRTNYHSFVIYTECIKHSMSKHFRLRRFGAMNKLFVSLFIERMFNRKDKKSASIFHLPKQPVAKARQKV
ncbi:MAG: hypothetical protein H7Y27_06310, partial [Gemmatimonadaceae bacterium]|nr:hypothetical protein [Chitinophagaceae bacterium]